MAQRRCGAVLAPAHRGCSAALPCILAAGVALMSVIGVAAAQEPPAPSRFLWSHQVNAMGWGDKVHYYTSLVAHAAAINRTAVLPPFEIVTYDYSPIADVDVAAEGIEAVAKRHKARSFDYVHESVYTEVDDWIDVGALEAPAVPHAAWVAATGGRVDLVVVPSSWHGCIPQHDEACAEAERAGELWLDERNGDLPSSVFGGVAVAVEAASCTPGMPDPSSEDAYENAMYTRALLGVLCDGCDDAGGEPDKSWRPPPGIDLHALVQRADAAATLGLDGWCLRGKLTPGMEALSQAVYKRFAFTPAVEDAADRWLRARGVERFVTVHWRRSDVLLDMFSDFGQHTPEHMAEAVRGVVLGRAAGSAAVGLTDIVLVTDNFVRPEMDRFAALLRDDLGVAVHRFDPLDEASTEGLPGALRMRAASPNGDGGGGGSGSATPSALSVAQVRALFMDLAIAGRSDALVANYYGSNYAAFAQQLRARRFRKTGRTGAWSSFVSTDQARRAADVWRRLHARKGAEGQHAAGHAATDF